MSFAPFHSLLGRVGLAHPAPGASPSPGPRAASIVKYGRDGRSEAAHVAADYGRVAYDGEGKVTGGQLSYHVQSPEGAALSRSTAALGGDGKPTTIASTILDRRTGAEYRDVRIDLGGLKWSVADRIASGQLALSSSPPGAPGPVVGGAMIFDRERLAQLDLTHYLPQSHEAVSGYTTIDYRGARLLGDRIASGDLTITSRRPDRSESSSSVLSFSPAGLPALMTTKSFATGSTEPASVTRTDWAGVEFDNRNRIASGELQVTTQDRRGVVRSHSLVRFAGGLPGGVQSRIFSAAGDLLRVVTTDFRGATFDNANRVVSSTIAVTCTGPDGAVESRSRVAYDAHGHPSRRTITLVDAAGAAGDVTEVDYSEAGFNHRRRVVTGRVTSRTVKAGGTREVETVLEYSGGERPLRKSVLTRDLAGGKPPQESRTIRRGDGTLAETVVQTGDRSATITRYGPNGKTVVEALAVDYSDSKIAAGGIAGGSVQITAQDGRKHLRSRATLDYSRG